MLYRALLLSIFCHLLVVVVFSLFQRALPPQSVPLRLVAQIRSFIVEPAYSAIVQDYGVENRSSSVARKREISSVARQAEHFVASDPLPSETKTMLESPVNVSNMPAVVTREPHVSPPLYRAAYLDNPSPAYPLAARRRGQEGVVRIEALVDRDGRVRESRVKTPSGTVDLDESALSTVRRWRFIPAKSGDEPVEAWVTVPIRFQLDLPSGAL